MVGELRGEMECRGPLPKIAKASIQLLIPDFQVIILKKIIFKTVFLY
jgi:hypothetical protein